MKHCNEEKPDTLERDLREGLRQRAQGIRPEAQVFWAMLAERISKKEHGKEQSKPL